MFFFCLLNVSDDLLVGLLFLKRKMMNIIIHFEIVECNYNHLHEEDDAKLKKKIIKELT